jgi:transcription initiation factor TFIIIB Brf1 subunit/transcription initiation factor TFIIB
MESTQQLGTEGTRAIERCRECRGHVVQAGEEFVCTSCGVVARKVEEEKFHLGVHIQAPSQLASRRLGSYLGDRRDADSTANFNGTSTVGFAKRISDNMGQDQTAWNCAAMIRRAADRLSLPPFVRANATALSEKMLADSRSNGGNGKRRTSVPAVSAYALLSACRAAGMDHVSAKAVLQTYVDMGHRVTKSKLLRLGTDSGVPFRPADPAALVRTILGCLEANGAVCKKLASKGVEPGPYFRKVLQASQTVIGAVRTMGEGRSPRTLAAGAVYIASREVVPGVVTQRDVAETMGVSEYSTREFVAKVGCELSPLNGGTS